MKKQDQKIIALPPVKPGKGKPVLSVLKQRKTVREVGDKKIPIQLLSNLLWAACGVNRKKGPFGIPGRTAASGECSLGDSTDQLPGTSLPPPLGSFGTGMIIFTEVPDGIPAGVYRSVISDCILIPVIFS